MHTCYLVKIFVATYAVDTLNKKVV